MFKHDNNIRNLRHNSHQRNNLRMPQNTLHHDLILNFLKEVVCYLWVKNFLDSTRSVVECTFVNNWESSLTNLLTELDIWHLNFSDSWYHGQPSCADWDFFHVWGKLWKPLFTNISLQIFNLNLEFLLCFLFISQAFFKFTDFLILRACSHGSFKRLHSPSLASSEISPIVRVLLGYGLAPFHVSIF